MAKVIKEVTRIRCHARSLAVDVVVLIRVQLWLGRVHLTLLHVTQMHGKSISFITKTMIPILLLWTGKYISVLHVYPKIV